MHYLENEGIELMGQKIWGAPYLPNPVSNKSGFGRGKADRKAIFTQIPDDTDILLTHGPAILQN